MSFLLAVLAFGLLIAFHEFGHLWVAKKTGMRVERFSVGFGPVIFSRKVGDTEYAISAVPLGGYVKIAGMTAEDEGDPSDPKNFMNRPAWARLATIAAGPFANYLLAFLIGVPLLLVANVSPDPTSTRVGDVFPGEPAERAGLRPGDDLRAIDGRPLHDFLGIRTAINTVGKEKPGQPVPIALLRDGQPLVVMVTPRPVADSWVIGVGPWQKRDPGLPLSQAIPQAVKNIGLASATSINVLGKLFTGGAKVSDLSGPIGMINATAAQARKGLVDYVKTVWGLSVAIGFFNLLPIPALDGGRAVFLAYEIVARRRVNQKVEGIIHTIGLFALLALILFVSYGDVVRKFRGG